MVFLRGTNRAADRFARFSFFFKLWPTQIDKKLITVVPQQSFAFQSIAGVLSVQRTISVPFGLSTPDQPNIASTFWRTVIDHKNRVYIFDSATSANTFWVSLDKLNFKSRCFC